MNDKAQIWISALLYILIAVIVMVIILEATSPLLENLKDESVYTETKSNFVSLNQHISDVSNAGTGSQRVVPVEIRKGELKVGNDQ
ncbi:hypothetical protein KY339_04940, partial [Candidatus Woesearchaeota archaeon]|nr:hypothetical protein [Candidatus Woesearchaeota archaeon]